MRFSFSEEQEAFRDVLRRFFSDRSPTTEVRRQMEGGTGHDPEVWRAFAAELGAAAIHVPEAYGGAGLGVSELAIAAEEAGRALACLPFFGSSVMAATAILQAGSESQKRSLLPGIAAGDGIAALAAAEPDGDWEPDSIAMSAVDSDGGHRLAGVKTHVLDGMAADTIVAVAREADGSLGLFALPADSPGLVRRPLDAMDPTRRLARLEFGDVPAERLGEAGVGEPAYARTYDTALVCLANEMVGGAERLREDALEYVSMRIQFGRPIASFQVTKHKAADMLLDVELAKSAAYYAAAAPDEDDDDLSATASLAKAGASDAYIRTAVHAVQMHGGIGFTYDNDTHLWFKRAKSSEAFLGTASAHRERMMRHWRA